jgi:hypothetical protein
MSIYEVQFRLTSYYADDEYNKTTIVTEKYGADTYDEVVHMISDNIDNHQISDAPVLNPDAPELPITVEIDFVQIVNEYGELEYLDEANIDV